MPVDTSIYNNLKTEPINPLKTIADVMAIQNAQQQFQYAQGKNTLQNAAIKYNRILADNTVDGITDYAKAHGEAAKDPEAAPYIAAGQDISNINLAPVTKFNPLTNQNDTISLQAQSQGLNPLRQQTDQNSSQQVNSPQTPAPTQKQLDDVHTHFDYLGNAVSGLMKKPDLSTSDIINTIADANAEFVKSGGKKGLSTQEASGVMGTIPAGVNGGEASPQELVAWLQPKLAQIQGHQAMVTQQFGAPSSSKQTSANQSGFVNPSYPAEPPIGKKEQIGNAVADQATIDQEAKRASFAKPALQHMYDLSVAGADTGTAAEKINNIYGALVSFGLATPGITQTNKQITELAKYANQNVQAQGGSEGTNKQLDALNSANVNIEQAPEIFQNLLRSGLAQAQSKIGLQSALRNQLGTNPDPDKNRSFINDWNQKHDQRVMEYAITPDSKKKAYLKNIPKNELPGFLESYDYLQSVNALPK